MQIFDEPVEVQLITLSFSVKPYHKLRNLPFILRQKLHELGSFHNWHAVNYTDIRPRKVESSIRLCTFSFM